MSLFQDIHEDSLILFKLLSYGDRSLITDSMEKETRKKNMDGLAKITIAMRVQVNIYFENYSGKLKLKRVNTCQVPCTAFTRFFLSVLDNFEIFIWML